MNRGEVWAVTHEDGTTRRVAIVSGGAWNQGAQPQAVAVIDDRDAFEVPPFLVAAEGEPDSITGFHLAMESVGPFNPSDGGEWERIGTLTAATLTKVSTALRQLYEL